MRLRRGLIGVAVGVGVAFPDPVQHQAEHAGVDPLEAGQRVAQLWALDGAGTDDDEERIARGSTALDGFYAHFTRRKED